MSNIQFCVWLTFWFIFLKCVDVIVWPWLWVFSPLWLPIVILFGLLALAVAIGTTVELSEAVVDTVWPKPAWR